MGDNSAGGSGRVEDGSAGGGWQVGDGIERTVEVAELVCLPVKRVDGQFNKYKGR